MVKPGKLVVVSGPSGCGKSTVVREVMKRADVRFSVSVTTRKPRPGEVDGRDYRFVGRRTFERMADAGELLEWAEVFGQLYGTPAEPVKIALAEGRTIVLDVDVQGGRQVCRQMPEAVFVLIVPPSEAELARRLAGRGSEDQAQLAERLAKADAEVKAAIGSGIYDHVVVNDDLEQAVRRVVEIVEE